MDYYFGKTLAMSFDAALEKVTEALGAQGFGILTSIDMKATLHKKIGAELRPYTILGACHPPSAFKAVSIERNIGLLMPCNVVVQESGENMVEVAAVNPLVSMQAVRNDALVEVATEVSAKLQAAIATL